MPLMGLSYRDVSRKLRKAGFKEVNSKRQHVKFAKEMDEEIRTAIVPHHKEI
jgi:predicted RNA binding protein YcfA (HicA-like mRNA interferase family)